MLQRALVAVGMCLTLSLHACGSGDMDSRVELAAIRVGDVPIGKQALDHWTAVIARGAPVVNPFSSQRDSPRQQALAYLIASNWLIGEAADHGMRLSEEQARRHITEQWESAPDGRAEFEDALKASGQTISDIEFETRVQWATSAVRELLMGRADRLARASVTDATVASYYHSHIAEYRYKERRDYDIIENLPSVAAARALGRKIGPGKRFADMALHEFYPRPRNFNAGEGKGAILGAVFSSAIKPGIISAPMMLKRKYAIFVLRRINPPGVKRFAAVRNSIEQGLLRRRRQRITNTLVKAYRAKWTARTSCQRAYVVQKCRQYSGPMAPEPSVFAGS